MSALLLKYVQQFQDIPWLVWGIFYMGGGYAI